MSEAIATARAGREDGPPAQAAPPAHGLRARRPVGARGRRARGPASCSSGSPRHDPDLADVASRAAWPAPEAPDAPRRRRLGSAQQLAAADPPLTARAGVLAGVASRCSSFTPAAPSMSARSPVPVTGAAYDLHGFPHQLIERRSACDERGGVAGDRRPAPRDPGAPVGGPAGLLRPPDGRPRRPGRDRAGVLGRSAGRRRGGRSSRTPRSSWSGGSAGGSSAAAGPPRAAPRWWPSGSPVLGRPAGPGPPSRPRSGRSAPSRDPGDGELETWRSRARTLGGPWRRGPPDARSGHRWTSSNCSATRPSTCSPTSRRASPRKTCSLPGPDFVDRVFAVTDRTPAGAAQPAVMLSTTAAWAAPATCRSCRSTRASSTRPRRRSPEPEVLRPGEHRRAGHRGRLQRGRHHVRRARRGVAHATPTASRSS